MVYRHLLLKFIMFLLIINVVSADSPAPKILLVGDAHFPSDTLNTTIYKFYSDALIANGYSFDSFNVTSRTDDGPSLSTLSNYDIVIWFTGQDAGNLFPTLTSNDQTNLNGYLNGGGNLFLTGENIGFDIGQTNFYKLVPGLSSYFCKDKSGKTDLSGATNDPIGDGLSIRISGGTGANNQDSPSVVFFRNGTYILFNNASTAYVRGYSFYYREEYSITCDDGQNFYRSFKFVFPGVVRLNESNYKTVYFSFGFEGISDINKRNTIMDRIIKYLTPPATKNTILIGSTGVQNLTNSILSINATCIEDQLFGKITAAEYFIDSIGSSGSGTPLYAKDGIFDSGTENVTGVADTSTLTEGIHTIYVHCKNSDNKWGKFDQVNFTVDRTPPGRPTVIIQNDEPYTNQVKPTLTLGIVAGTGDIPDFFALSCDNVTYTDWIPWYPSSSTSITYSHFDITTGAGCSNTDGLKRVYVKVRDKAGNEQPIRGDDTITLDRVNPIILSIVPANNSFVNSARNITIKFSDDNSGIKNSTYNNGTTTDRFENNTPFNPGWTTEGTKTLTIRIFDNAGNLNESIYTFIVDNTPPSTTDNSSNIVGWKNTDQTIGLTCSDPPLSGDIIPVDGNAGSGCSITLFCVDSSGTCVPSTSGNIVSVTCAFGSVCQQYVRYHSNDTANNTESIKTSNLIKIDKSNPSVTINSPSNNQYVKGTITINSTVTDTGSGVDKVFFNISNTTWSSGLISMTASGGFYIGTFDTTALKDGNYNITIFANDTVNNVNYTQYVNVNVDNTPPSTTDNSTTLWYSTDQTIELTCSDSGSGCNFTLYCLGVSCEPSTAGTIINITCPSGSTCIQIFRYRSNDTLNNLEDIKSNTTKIDKQAPTITIENPLNSTYSGIVQLLTTISDFGSGADKAWYEIRNASNLSQIMKSGFLTAENNWDDVWNSSDIITGTFVFNVSANDTVGNLNYNVNVTFSIDNTLPTITIVFPKAIYKNSNFNLDIRAQTVSASNNISNASWYIYNSYGIQKSNTTFATGNAINAKSFDFTDFIDISTLSDGNYTLNATANDTSNNQAIDITWFALDRLAPFTTDNSSSIVGIGPDKWNNTDQIIGLTCSDGSLPDGTLGSGCDKTLYCINTTTTDCTPNIAGTLVSVTCPSGSTCIQFVKYRSNDTVNNIEITKSSNAIRIDKQAPVTTDNSTGLWYATDQTISLICNDIGVGCNTTLYCVDTSSTCIPNTTGTIVSVTCPSGSFCEKFVVYSSKDNLNNIEPNKISNPIRIDKEKPSVVISYPTHLSIVKGIITINSIVNDGGSGVDKVFYRVTNGSFAGNLVQMSPIASNYYSGTLDTTTLADGAYNITIFANDTVNNVNSSQFVTIIIDNTAPLTSNYSFDISIDPTFNDYRIYTRGSIIFYVNVTDATNVSRVVVSINGINSTMSLLSGSLKNGIWFINYTNTTNLGLYTINNLFVNDTLGNTRVINQSTINKSFIVVNATVNISLDGTKSIDASDTKTFYLNFSFNKTVTNPNILIFVPPNSPSNFTQSPNYVNASSYTCSFGSGCSLSFYNDSSGKITVINATGIGNGTFLYITSNQTAQMVPEDSIDIWIARFNNFNYQDSTRIKVPFLNISLITCNGNVICTVDQYSNFTLNVSVENVNQSSRTGKAFNVTAKYINLDAALNDTFVLGDILSNASSNASWIINISKAGNLTFNFDAFDKTLKYNATTKSVIINVIDKELPSVSSVSIDNYIVNLNDSITLTVVASDNIKISKVIAEINDSSNSLANYTLSLLSGTESFGTWSLNYNDTVYVGNYKINKIYVNDTTNNMITYLPNISFEVRNLSVSAALSSTNLTIKSNLTIIANVTGNASAIDSVIAIITKPRNYTEIISLSYNQTFANNIYQFVGTYTNTSRSGDYTVLVNVSANRNAFDSKTFSVNFGNITISAADTFNVPVTAGVKNFTLFIIPTNGDLINVTGYLTISNQSVANITSDESFIKIFGNVTAEDNPNGMIAYWTINETNIGTTDFIIVINSSFNNVTANKTVVVNVLEEDTLAPFVSIINQTSDAFNLFEPNTIKINAIDNTVIDNVTIEMTYPSGVKENLTATQIDPTEYSLIFSNINETGNYSFRAIAFDVSGNSNSTEQFNFTSFNNYTVIVKTNHPIYNKRENISIDVQVLNVNNKTVKDFNLTLILDRGGSNITLVNNQMASQGSYVIDVLDNPTSGNAPSVYTIYASVNKNGNFGNNQTSVNVSRIFRITFSFPTDGTFFDVGDIVPMDVQVYNSRGEVVTNARVIAQCSQCERQFNILNFDPNRSYFNPAAFVAPATENKKFSIFIYASDAFGNSQGDVIPGILLTTEKPVSQPAAGAGAGGAGGLVGGGELINQTIITKDFEFKLSQSIIEIVRGMNSTLLGSLTNKGNTNLIVESSISKQCCEIFVQKMFSLSIGGSKSVEINIHVPLYTEEGEYLSVVRMVSSDIVKEQSFKIIVKQNPLISELININNSIFRLDLEISELENAGIDISKIKSLRNSLLNKINAAFDAIENDNLNLLSSLSIEIKREFTQLSNDILGLQLIKFISLNKWNIAGIVISSLIAFYIINQIWLPYYRLRKEITALQREEKSLIKSRVETEKQYFLRKIDEKTFFTIMAQKQGEILKVRGKIKNLEEELSKLIIKKLHPLSFVSWLKLSGLNLLHLPSKLKFTIKVDVKSSKKYIEKGYFAKAIESLRPKVKLHILQKIPKPKIFKVLSYNIKWYSNIMKLNFYKIKWKLLEIRVSLSEKISLKIKEIKLKLKRIKW